MPSNPSMQRLWLLVPNHGLDAYDKTHHHLSFNASIKTVWSLCLTDKGRIDEIVTCILNVVKYAHRLLCALKVMNVIQCVA